MGELLDRVSSAELAEWMAFERVHGPFGDQRADQHAGVVAATVANVFRRRRRPHKVADFVPRWGPRPEAGGDELLARAAVINAVLGGVDLRGDDRGADGAPGGGHQRRP